MSGPAAVSLAWNVEVNPSKPRYPSMRAMPYMPVSCAPFLDCRQGFPISILRHATPTSLALLIEAPYANEVIHVFFFLSVGENGGG